MRYLLIENAFRRYSLCQKRSKLRNPEETLAKKAKLRLVAKIESHRLVSPGLFHCHQSHPTACGRAHWRWKWNVTSMICSVSPPPNCWSCSSLLWHSWQPLRPFFLADGVRWCSRRDARLWRSPLRRSKWVNSCWFQKWWSCCASKGRRCMRRSSAAPFQSRWNSAPASLHGI